VPDDTLDEAEQRKEQARRQADKVGRVVDQWVNKVVARTNSEKQKEHKNQNWTEQERSELPIERPAR